MNPDHMSIEEGPNPLPFHGKFETDLRESVSQSHKTVSTHCNQSTMGISNFNCKNLDLEMSSVYKDGIEKLFTEAVSN